MDIKFEPLAIIRLNETETKLIAPHIPNNEFDCNALKALIQNPLIADDAKTIIKQMYATVMSEDAWYCKLIKADVAIEVATAVAPAPIVNAKAKQRVLFLNTVGGSEVNNPIAVLVEIPGNVTSNMLTTLEGLQAGSARWLKIMQDGEIPYLELKRGRKQTFNTTEYDMVHYLKQVRPMTD